MTPMSQKPFTAAALRGAVDLSALKRPPAARSGMPGGPGGAAGAASAGGWTAAARAGMPGGAGGAGSAGGAGGAAPNSGARVVTATDATFQEVATTSVRVPVVVVLHSGRLPESGAFVDVLAVVARANGGRFQVAVVDVDTNPGLLRAFQVQSVPAVMGLIQGQPVPLFVGAMSATEVQPWIEELLKLAVQYGVTGRVSVDGPAGTAGTAGTAGNGDAGTAGDDDELEAELPPLLQEAYDAIDRGDLDGAAAAYEKALAENPADAEARLGLGQVKLLQRTQGVELTVARAAAAAAPDDVPAQLLVADLDVLGGHLEDAFGRLVDLVRVSVGAERDQVRQHLLGLFDIVGAQDPRVVKARKALMAALF
jgi:putative thioredoxin